MPFRDRQDAGSQLAALLGESVGEDVVVLGLPRGGVVVAEEVARALGAPLDVLVVRKLGAPFQPEFGIGAIAEGGAIVLDDRALSFGITPEQIEHVRHREEQELARRVRLFRGDRPPPDLRGRTVILVDDGIATGGTARAAIKAIRKLGPRRIVLATAVAATDTALSLSREVDELVCVETPENLTAIGLWYEDFRQVSDEEVIACLDRARRGAVPVGAPRRLPFTIRTRTAALRGDLVIPEGARGIVLFAHGSGSSRLSPRNRYVAHALHDVGLATLLFDLLTAEEEEVDERTAMLRFDVRLLAQRLEDATRFVEANPDTRHLRVGYFGASTGAAAALIAAAGLGDEIFAIVSRGGRPDLAGEALAQVAAPTLLIVGGDDHPVIEMNRAALVELRCEKELVIVPGATHLFAEPGTLEEVARLAGEWFARHLHRPETVESETAQAPT